MKRIKPKIIIGICVLLCVALVISGFYFAPYFYANKRLSEYRELLITERVEYAIISDPINQTNLLPVEYEVMLKDELLWEICDILTELLDSVEYSGKSKAIIGNWDVRVRLYADEGFYEIYVSHHDVYFAKNMKNYHFRTTDGALRRFDSFLETCKTADME